MKRQFTATAYVLEDRQVLLLWHRKLQKWLPPGGHVEENELPSEAAIREVKEETGIEAEILQRENVWIERWNARSFPRPFMCLLEEIPTHGDEPAHQHMDFIYLAKPVGGVLRPKAEEADDARWFDWDAISQMRSDIDIFEETRQVLEQLLVGEISLALSR